MTLDEAILAVQTEQKNPHAIAYAQSMGEARSRFGREGERVQILYILNNLGGWRGSRAKQVKEALKAFSKEG